MMTHPLRSLTLFAVALGLLGCESGTPVTVEELPAVSPNLPPVPTIPPPPYPVTYSDESYSIYGARARREQTLNEELTFTAYIVNIFEPPECEEEPCPRPTAPHFWIADARDLEDQDKWMRVVGYAERHSDVEEAVELARRGRYEPPPPETGLTPIPVDLFVGNKIKITGRFAVGGAGFQESRGLLNYKNHETLENLAEE